MAELVPFLPLIAIALLFWLMVVRPASRRQRQVAEMQAAISPGQRVMLTSGIFGTVVSLSEERAEMEVAPGIRIEVVRAAIGAVEESAAEEPPAEVTPTTHDDQDPQD